MSVSGIAPAILQKYEEHSQLIADLASVEYVDGAYEGTLSRMDQVKKELKVKREHVQELSKKTQSEFKDVQELQRSASKRFFLRITEGKDGLKQKKAREEQEYLDAFMAENSENMAIKTLEEELKLLQDKAVDLKKKEEKMHSLKRRLDEIYKELFGGLTNDYPEEDAAEREAEAAESNYRKVKETLTRETEVNSVLIKAEKSLRKVTEKLNRAELICQKELVSGTLMANVFNMKELRSAKKYAMEFEVYIQSARKLEPKVAEIGPIGIPTQDNRTSISVDQADASQAGIQILRLITAACKDCVRHSVKLEMELDKSKERLQSAAMVAVEKGTTLREKRSALENIRRRIIEQVHRGVLPSRGPAGGPWVFGGPHDSGNLGGAPEAPGIPGLPPGFPMATGTPTSSIKMNFPAGGFRSNHGSVEGIEVAPVGSGPSPTFPDAPQYEPPVTGFAPTTPGFRGAAEMGVIASIAAISFPEAAPQWAVNPQAAALFLQAGDQAEALKPEDVSMPMAPDNGLTPPLVPPVPDTPSSPMSPMAGTAAGWPSELKDGEQLLYQGRGKFFQFAPDTNDPNWEKAGKGDFRMVIDKGTSHVRITVMLNDGKTKDLDLTGDLRPLPSLGPNRELVWNVVATSTIAVRLPSVEEAKRFRDAYDRARSSPLTASPMSQSTLLPGVMPGLPDVGGSDAGFSMPSFSPGPGASPAWPSGPQDNRSDTLPMPGGPAPLWPGSPADNNKQPPPPVTDRSDSMEPVTASVAALNIHKKTAPPAAAPSLPQPSSSGASGLGGPEHS